MARWTGCFRFNANLTAVVLLALTCAAPVRAAAPLEVVGLFKHQAVIRVGGQQRLLKVGQTSPEGVELVKATAHAATVLYGGEQYVLSLSNRVASGFQAAEKAAVSITSDELGQYRVRGAINSHYVNFLVDTGASVVALSSQAAQRMGIAYEEGEKGIVQTAQGTADSFFVVLDQVTVAGINAHNVQAAVIDGEYPLDILLGMSFLRRVAIAEQGGVMTLTQKF